MLNHKDRGSSLAADAPAAEVGEDTPQNCNSNPVTAHHAESGNDMVPELDIQCQIPARGAMRKRRRRDSAALLEEEAKRFCGQGTLGEKDATYIRILFKRMIGNPTDMLPRL